MRTLLAIFLLGAAAGPAFAESELALRVVGQTPLGERALGSSLTQAELGYGRELVRRGPLQIWGEANYSVGDQGTLLGSVAQAQLLVQTITVGGRLAVPIRRWLVPMVRVGAGVLVGRLRLDATSGVHTQSWSTAPSVYALFGFAAFIPHKGRVGFGGVLEGGFAAAGDLGFSAEPVPAPDATPIPTSGTHLGSLQTSGPVIRFGIAVRF